MTILICFALLLLTNVAFPSRVTARKKIYRQVTYNVHNMYQASPFATGTMPNRGPIAFLVARSSPFGPFTNATTVTWDQVVTLQGVGWQHDQSQFVANTSGLYVFHLVVGANFDTDEAGPSHCMAQIRKNGVAMMRAYTSWKSSWAIGSAHVPLVLQLGDTVDVQLEESNVLYSSKNVRSHFSGYLVTAF